MPDNYEDLSIEELRSELRRMLLLLDEEERKGFMEEFRQP